MTSVVYTKNSRLIVLGMLYIESFCHTAAAMRLTRWGIATSVLPYCRRYAAYTMGDCHICSTILPPLCGLRKMGFR